MKNNLPYLNEERLGIIFGDHPAGERFSDDEKLSDLLVTLTSMQSFNHRHRPDDTRALFGVLNGEFNFERNSEGTTLWLSMALAVKELYGFSERKLASVLKQIRM